MRCPLCQARPARRSCPALGRDICPVCCGTKREVEIRCPDSCPYLVSARSHPPAAIRKQQDHDLALLSPALAGLTEPRRQLFLFALTLLERFRGDGLDAAGDADVASAAAALAATYETASRGLIYEQRPDSIPAQRLADGLKGVLDQLGHGRPSAFAADAAAVLRQLEDRARAVQGAAGGGSRAFLDLAGRVARRLGSSGPEAPPGADQGVEGGPGASSIILP